VFGHIHEDAGVVTHDETLCVNACSCDLSYRVANPPVVIDWHDGAPRRASDG
jgi:Icc-related predicted phosphoesterase